MQFTNNQLKTILSTLCNTSRNPKSKTVALRAIAHFARSNGVSLDHVLGVAGPFIAGEIDPTTFVARATTPPPPPPAPAVKTGSRKSNKGAPTRAGTKTLIMLDMMRQPEGASVHQMSLATGWQPQAVRGVIYNQQKRLGFKLELEKAEKGQGNYKIVG